MVIHEIGHRSEILKAKGFIVEEGKPQTIASSHWNGMFRSAVTKGVRTRVPGTIFVNFRVGSSSIELQRCSGYRAHRSRPDVRVRDGHRDDGAVPDTGAPTRAFARRHGDWSASNK